RYTRFEQSERIYLFFGITIKIKKGLLVKCNPFLFIINIPLTISSINVYMCLFSLKRRMKKMIFFVVLFCSTIGFSQQQNATFTTNPTFFEENDEIVLTVSDIDPGLWGVTDIYLWAWYYDTDGNPAGDSPTNGTWENSNESQKFTNNGNG